MLAVKLEALNHSLVVDADADEPRPTGDEELIEVTACGVCHSDLHVVDGDYPTNLPIILGHEVTGVHPEMGPVMVYAPWGCGHCPQCDDGLEMICANSSEAGLVVDGGYAQRMVVRHRRYLAPLGDLDPVNAAPLACGGLTAYRAVRHTLDLLRGQAPNLGPSAGTGRRRRALVIGAGGLGQFAIRYLRALTDAEVIALDRAADKRQTAIAMGAHRAVDAVTDLGSVDAVIDFAGAQSTLEAARTSVARRGIVVLVGLAGGSVPFGFGQVPHESRWMTSVWGSRAELDDLLDLARREPSIIQPVEVLPLAEAQTAHDRLRSGDVKGRIVLVAN